MIKFTKMHSLGNDFVVIDEHGQDVTLNSRLAKHIAHRYRGIGCDQILLVNPGHCEGKDFILRILNQDGSESAQCGNGARCVARFLYDRGYAKSNELTLKTSAAEMRCTIDNNDQVTVGLGIPQFQPQEIPFLANQQQEIYDLTVRKTTVPISALSLGNPHAVTIVDDVKKAPVKKIGQAIESHRRFPQRTNVGFMQVMSRETIQLRVFERGVGETFACGSGSGAAVVAGIRLGLLDKSVKVSLKGGELQVSWLSSQSNVLLSGPTTYVFEGHLR